jgi:hypothetical protein
MAHLPDTDIEWTVAPCEACDGEGRIYHGDGSQPWDYIEDCGSCGGKGAVDVEITRVARTLDDLEELDALEAEQSRREARQEARQEAINRLIDAQNCDLIGPVLFEIIDDAVAALRRADLPLLAELLEQREERAVTQVLNYLREPIADPFARIG